jgi:hypothetical protein
MTHWNSVSSPTPNGQRECIASVHIPARTIHRLAVADAYFLEASTPELDDVVRIEDDHGRTIAAAVVSGRS